MNDFKLARNVWLFVGVSFFISFILRLMDNKSIIWIILNGITCFLSFVNAYNIHKTIIKEKRKQRSRF